MKSDGDQQIFVAAVFSCASFFLIYFFLGTLRVEGLNAAIWAALRAAKSITDVSRVQLLHGERRLLRAVGVGVKCLIMPRLLSPTAATHPQTRPPASKKKINCIS